MRICNLNDGLGQLTHALSELNDALAKAQAHWNDDNRRQFEEDHLCPIQPQMQLLVAAAQALGTTVEKATRELDDSPER